MIQKNTEDMSQLNGRVTSSRQKM